MVVGTFAWVPDMAVQNAWLLYRTYKTTDDPELDLLAFRREIESVYLAKYKTELELETKNTQKRKRKAQLTSSVPVDIRCDMVGHFQEYMDRNRCALCNKSTQRCCIKCDKGLRNKCFNEFHGLK